MKMDISRLEAEADEALEAMLTKEEAPKETETEQGQPVEVIEDTLTDDVAPKEEYEPQNEEAQSKTDVDQPKSELEVVEERLANAQRRMTQATQEAADLRRINAELTEKVNTLEASTAKQPDNAIDDASALDKLDEVAKEFEDFAPLVTAIRQIQNQVGNIEQTTHQVQQKTAQQEAQEASQAYENAIVSVHPDAFELAGSDALKSWLLSQPPFFSKYLFGDGAPNSAGTPEQVNYVLTKYKQETAKPATPNKVEEAKKLATPNVRSQGQTPNSKPNYTPQQIANMSLKEFEKYESEIDDWMTSGRTA